VKEEAPVIVIMKDAFPAVAPRHDLIIGTGILDAKAARHARQWLKRSVCQLSHPDPVSPDSGSELIAGVSDHNASVPEMTANLNDQGYRITYGIDGNQVSMQSSTWPNASTPLAPVEKPGVFGRFF
jgi:hypothetical protein